LAIRVVRLGSPRAADEGLRLGTVRRPPRGVRKDEYGSRDYFDVWLPELAPSDRLLRWVSTAPLTPGRWKTFARRYRAEMRKPSARQLIALLGALSFQQNLSVGCYCSDESSCHRAVLRELLRDAGAAMRVNGDRGGVPLPATAGG
jgi:uncharacterized protein YeaO (DUF488 family)